MSTAGLLLLQTAAAARRPLLLVKIAVHNDWVFQVVMTCAAGGSDCKTAAAAAAGPSGPSSKSALLCISIDVF
jgi:hypothetical protein